MNHLMSDVQCISVKSYIPYVPMWLLMYKVLCTMYKAETGE
jgi:hypothetical protein